MGNERGLDESRGPIFRLPRPAWHYLFPGLLAIGLFSFAAFMEYGLLTRVPTPIGIGIEPRIRRLFAIPLWGIVLVLAPTLLLRKALTSPLVIREHGLEFERSKAWSGTHGHVFLFWVLGWMFETIGWIFEFGRWEHRIVTWERIGGCHWGRYSPGTLTIHGPEGLVLIKVPERYRPEVESAIRQVGKWQD